MKFQTRRMLAFISVGTYLFLTGLENAIILPTAWQYLHHLGATQNYIFGITVAGFSACAMISGLIGGRLSDAYPTKSKIIVILAIITMVIGNTQYLVGGSVVNVVMGRVVCGVGAFCGSTLLAEVGRTTSPKERTTILSICNGLRQIGLLIGPGFQLVLEYFDFSLFNGALIVKPYNAPGLFMATLWFVFLIYALAFYHNLDVEYRYEVLRRQHESGADLSGYSMELTSSHEQPVDEGPSEAARRWYFIEENFSKELSPQPVTFATYVNELFHDDTVVLFGMSMALFFCQVLIETIIPPVMTERFGYTSYETSLIYMIAGSISISVYFTIALTTRWTSDVFLLTFGWLMHCLGYIWLIYWLPQIQPGDVDKVPMFAVGVILMYIGFPIGTVGTTSLLTKCASLRVQGIAQGLRRVGTFAGLILGPMWGGATLNRSYLQMGVPFALILFMGILFGFSFRKIQKGEKWAMTERK